MLFLLFFFAVVVVVVVVVVENPVHFLFYITLFVQVQISQQCVAVLFTVSGTCHCFSGIGLLKQLYTLPC